MVRPRRGGDGHVNIVDEQRQAKVARTLVVLHAFKMFYDQGHMQSIVLLDGAFCKISLSPSWRKRSSFYDV